MAIVGPRPTLAAHVEHFSIAGHPRFDVLPGITGWAQVQGRAGIPWEERVELDAWYAEHRSLWLDLRILAKTVGWSSPAKASPPTDVDGPKTCHIGKFSAHQHRG